MRGFDASLVVSGVRARRRQFRLGWFAAGVLAALAFALAIGAGARP